MGQGNRTHLILLAVILSVFIVAGLAVLPLPFLRDQGIYAYLAWCWSEGLMPYKDAFGHKGPVLYAVYAISLGISRGAMWGPNMADLAARTLTVVLLYFCGRIYFDSKTGLLAALFAALPLTAVYNSCWWNAQAETFMMPLIVLSLILAAPAKGKSGALAVLLSGIIVAQAVMLKSTAGLHAVFLVGYIAARKTEDRSIRIGYFMLGLAAGCLAWIIYFAMNGALKDLFEDVVIFNAFHARINNGPGLTEILGVGVRGLWIVSGLLLIPVAGFLYGCVARKVRHGDGMVCAWLIFSFLQVAVQAKFFLYHWLVLLPALGMAAARGMVYLNNARKAGKGAAFINVIVIALVALQSILFIRLYTLILDHYESIQYLRGSIDRGQYYARFQEVPREGHSDLNFSATWHMAHYLRENTQPEDRILVFGYEPGIYYLSARLSASRFHSDYPLTFPAITEREIKYQNRWKKEFMRDIESAHPSAVVVVRNDINVLEAEDSYSQAMRFKEFWAWLEKNYTQEQTIEDFIIYRMKAKR